MQSLPYFIPSFVSRDLRDAIVTEFMSDHRGRYKATKLAQRELGLSLRDAKQIVARACDFEWSSPLPSERS